MAEYISRETLLKAVKKMDRLDKESTPYEYNKEGYILLIESAPTADVVEVKHGYNATYINPVDEFVCSVCSFKCTDYTEIVTEENDDIWYRECEFDYCPRCGAKMDGGKEE